MFQYFCVLACSWFSARISRVLRNAPPYTVHICVLFEHTYYPCSLILQRQHQTASTKNRFYYQIKPLYVELGDR